MSFDPYDVWYRKLGANNKKKVGAYGSAASRRIYNANKTRATSAAAAPAAPSAGTPAPGPGVPPPAARNPNDPPAYNADEQARRNQLDLDYRRLTGRDPNGNIYGDGVGELQRTRDAALAEFDKTMVNARQTRTQGIRDAGNYAAAAGRYRSGQTGVDRNKQWAEFNKVDADYGDKGKYRAQANAAYATGMGDARANYDAGMSATERAARERELNFANAYEEAKAEPEAKELTPGQKFAQQNGWVGPWTSKPAKKPGFGVFQRNVPGVGMRWFMARTG